MCGSDSSIRLCGERSLIFEDLMLVISRNIALKEPRRLATDLGPRIPQAWLMLRAESS